MVTRVRRVARGLCLVRRGREDFKRVVMMDELIKVRSERIVDEVQETRESSIYVSLEYRGLDVGRSTYNATTLNKQTLLKSRATENGVV